MNILSHFYEKIKENARFPHWENGLSI